MTKTAHIDEETAARITQAEDKLRQGQIEEALAAFLTILNESPELPLVLHSVAVCHAQLGQIVQAIFFFARSLLYSDEFNPVFNLSVLLKQIGRDDLASQTFAAFTLGSNARESIARTILKELETGTLGQPCQIPSLWLFGEPNLAAKKRLKIFTDRAFLPHNTSAIDPLYGVWEYSHPDGPLTDTFHEFVSKRDAIFELTSLEKADVAIFPTQWRDGCYYPEAQRMADLAASKGKKLMIFFRGDDSASVSVTNSIIFQTSLYRPLRKAHEFSLPIFSEDFTKHYLGGKLPLRQKSEIASVSFCGRPITEKSHPRNTALYLLSQEKGITTDFVVRTEYWGGGAYHEIPVAERYRYRLEYVRNLVSSDYVLCCRGAGNFSIRLFEILSVGRIPVFLDTWCVLPAEEFVNWKDYFVWVDIHDMENIGAIVKKFHQSISNEEFLLLQQKARELWEQWLTPVGYYSNLYRYLALSNEQPV